MVETQPRNKASSLRNTWFTKVEDFPDPPFPHIPCGCFLFSKNWEKNLSFMKISGCRTLMKRSLSTTLLLKVSRGTHWYLTSSFLVATTKKKLSKQQQQQQQQFSEFTPCSLGYFSGFHLSSPTVFESLQWSATESSSRCRQTWPLNYSPQNGEKSLATELYLSWCLGYYMDIIYIQLII